MSRKVGEHTRTYYRRSQKGMEVEGNSEKEPEVLKKYLATTMGKWRDMRSPIERKKPVVR